jgi:hypothetical protein
MRFRISTWLAALLGSILLCAIAANIVPSRAEEAVRECADHCTNMYTICTSGAWGSRRPLFGPSCSDSLGACNSNCGNSPTRADSQIRMKSWEECERHCTSMIISCSGDINCDELSQGCTAMCGEIPGTSTGSGGLESGAGSDKSKAESYCSYFSGIADTNAQQVSAILKKGGDLTKMQQSWQPRRQRLIVLRPSPRYFQMMV